MVFLSLSILFTVMAYGYGTATQSLKVTKWCYDNIEAIASQKGFSVVRNLVSLDLNELNVDINYTDVNMSCLNSSNTTLCGVV